ncbi:MAG TPA: hypothetical protein VM163_10705 [bacterium]|nr:hypothetical protein [bacterium]
MARLRKIPYMLLYDGNEAPETAQRAAASLYESGAVMLSMEELTDLFLGDRGELPIELTVIEAQLQEATFEDIGFSGRLRRVVNEYDKRTDGGAFVSPKKDYRRSVMDQGITGMLAFGGIWFLELLFFLSPFELLRTLFFPGSTAVKLLFLSLLLGAGLAAIEGYFTGIFMGIFGLEWLIGILLGIILGGIRATCLGQPMPAAMFQCVVASTVIGADITIKKDDIDCVPPEWRAAIKGKFPEVVTITLIAHLLVYGINWVWSELLL